MRVHRSVLFALACLFAPSAALSAQSSVVPEPDHGNAISISATLPHSAPTVFAAAVLALNEAGFTVSDSSREQGRLATAPSFRWPAGTEAEKWHGPESPGVAVRIQIRPVGADSAAFGVTAIAPIRRLSVTDSSASNLRMISALQIANRVSKLLKAAGPQK